MSNNKIVKYINRDFDSLKSTLIDFSKTYFPDTYNDFTPNSTGMLFMEMASYVGDVLSFYLDNQIQETFIQYARQKENLFNLAYMLGYRPKVTSAASANVDFYQLLPATLSGSVNIPDYSYCIKLDENTVVTSTENSIKFLVPDNIDFSVSNSMDPTEVSVYQISGNQPTFYLLKKTRTGISATINTTTFTFGSPEQFSTVELNATNIIGILDIVDSDGNKWYEVPNLAQDAVFDTIKNTNPNNPNLGSGAEVPYLLKLKNVTQRFTTRFLNDTTLQMQFGSGITGNFDEEIVPNPDNVGSGLPFGKTKLTTAYSPLNFIFTDSYGVAPANTTLTVRYLTGGGITSNVSQNTLTSLDTSTAHFVNSTLGNNTTAQTVFNSLATNNLIAANGGKDGDTIEELRINSLGNYQNQLRTVTQDDYLIRALSMPSNLGTISKAFATPEPVQKLNPGESPTILDLYILSYNSNKTLSIASDTLKNNLKTYLSQYRMINDSIKIKDAYIVNIGIDFDIITLPNYNNSDVILKCINTITDYFNVDKWQINQPILLKELYVLLNQIEGVQTIKQLNISNKLGSALGYSDSAYDVNGATLDNVVYPSIDPMIFELKYPKDDIKGRIVSF
jgi:hypothetical protein